MQNFHELLVALEEAGGKKIRRQLSQLGDAYENLLFELGGTSEDSVRFILSVISNAGICNKSGADVFVLKISTEFFCMNEQQKQSVYDALFEMYREYDDLDFCWVVGDLISRNFNKQQALRFFKEQYSVATYNGREGIALGLDVIARQDGRSQEMNSTIRKILYSGS